MTKDDVLVSAELAKEKLARILDEAAKNQRCAIDRYCVGNCQCGLPERAMAQLIRNTDLTDCQQPKELRLWDIHVECWYRSGDNLEAIRRVITVEAKDSDDAKKRAIDYCDSTASCDKEWKDFEFVRGHTVERPEYPLEAPTNKGKKR